MKKIIGIIFLLISITAHAQNVGIGTTTPTATIDVLRGTANGGTAQLRGTTHVSHFNYSTTENTFIRAGKDSGNVILNDIPGGRVGIGTSTPNTSAILDISSTTKGFLPPRMTKTQILAVPTPAEGLIIYNTTAKKPCYYNGIMWLNFDGSSFYEIGENLLGGVLAYILQPGDSGYIADQFHGLIAAASDQSTAAEWGCSGTLLGASGIDIGTGNQNTITIIANCATAAIAAKICGDLVLNGYSDWFLPSILELGKLYEKQAVIGGFSTANYWSSTEGLSTNARSRDFGIGTINNNLKTSALYVRAIRAF